MRIVRQQGVDYPICLRNDRLPDFEVIRRNNPMLGMFSLEMRLQRPGIRTVQHSELHFPVLKHEDYPLHRHLKRHPLPKSGLITNPQLCLTDQQIQVPNGENPWRYQAGLLPLQYFRERPQRVVRVHVRICSMLLPPVIGKFWRGVLFGGY